MHIAMEALDRVRLQHGAGATVFDPLAGDVREVEHVVVLLLGGEAAGRRFLIPDQPGYPTAPAEAATRPARAAGPCPSSRPGRRGPA